MRKLEVDAEDLFASVAFDIDWLASGLWHQELDWGVAADALGRQILWLSGLDDRGRRHGGGGKWGGYVVVRW